MNEDFNSLAESLAKMISGGNGSVTFERLIKLLSTEKGKKVLAMLLSDGGENVKRAANSAKNGDMSGISSIMANVASTKEGAEILKELLGNVK